LKDVPVTWSCSHCPCTSHTAATTSTSASASVKPTGRSKSPSSPRSMAASIKAASRVRKIDNLVAAAESSAVASELFQLIEKGPWRRNVSRSVSRSAVKAEKKKILSI